MTEKERLRCLSSSVLRLCDTLKFSYEAASERCSLSSGYFGDIARGKTTPTVLTLEKLCIGFEVTPNDLLLSLLQRRELTFREPMPVTHMRCFCWHGGVTILPDCPRCGMTMEREYQSFCDRCGQSLSWKGVAKATLILPDK